FCELKGIKREFSVPRTPQQNGIAERKNRTLIEATRTLLADSLLLIPFWAEAVNTACYVQNRVLVKKSHNKTPYELLHGRLPSIGFIRPFGCTVTILNTLDHLGKFQKKIDEGFLVGYSVCSKAFRVFNSRTRIVQETLHNQIGDLSTHTTRYISPALTQKVFANMRRVGKGFFGVETPLFEGMLTAREITEEEIAEEHVQADNAVAAAVQETVAEDVANKAIPSTPTPLILPSPPSHAFPSTSQKLEIIKLKARVKRLEKANKVKSSKLRPLKKVGTSQRIKSSDDMEDVFNQGRMIDDLDKDEGIELVVDQVKDADTVKTEGRHAAKQAEK
nr:retrovirus-related Pol polyprotein from transposon TNT 1-94 [Tanacetum cinerariifolium]